MSDETLVNRQHKKHVNISMGPHPIMLRSMNAWSKYSKGEITFWNAMARNLSTFPSFLPGTPDAYNKDNWTRYTLPTTAGNVLDPYYDRPGTGHSTAMDKDGLLHICYTTVYFENTPGSTSGDVAGWTYDWGNEMPYNESSDGRQSGVQGALLYSKQNADGTWQTPIEIEGGPNSYRQGDWATVSDLLIDKEGNPHIIFSSGNIINVDIADPLKITTWWWARLNSSGNMSIGNPTDILGYNPKFCIDDKGDLHAIYTKRIETATPPDASQLRWAIYTATCSFDSDFVTNGATSEWTETELLRCTVDNEFTTGFHDTAVGLNSAANTLDLEKRGCPIVTGADIIYDYKGTIHAIIHADLGKEEDNAGNPVDNGGPRTYYFYKSGDTWNTYLNSQDTIIGTPITLIGGSYTDASNNGRVAVPRLCADKNGDIHILYHQYPVPTGSADEFYVRWGFRGSLYYSTITNAGSATATLGTTQVIETTQPEYKDKIRWWEGSWAQSQIMGFDIDAGGKAHITYQMEYPTKHLEYATNQSGTWKYYALADTLHDSAGVEYDLTRFGTSSGTVSKNYDGIDIAAGIHSSLSIHKDGKISVVYNSSVEKPYAYNLLTTKSFSSTTDALLKAWTSDVSGGLRARNSSEQLKMMGRYLKVKIDKHGFSHAAFLGKEHPQCPGNYIVTYATNATGEWVFYENVDGTYNTDPTAAPDYGAGHPTGYPAANSTNSEVNLHISSNDYIHIAWLHFTGTNNETVATDYSTSTFDWETQGWQIRHRKVALNWTGYPTPGHTPNNTQHGWQPTTAVNTLDPNSGSAGGHVVKGVNIIYAGSGWRKTNCASIADAPTPSYHVQGISLDDNKGGSSGGLVVCLFYDPSGGVTATQGSSNGYTLYKHAGSNLQIWQTDEPTISKENFINYNLPPNIQTALPSGQELNTCMYVHQKDTTVLPTDTNPVRYHMVLPILAQDILVRDTNSSATPTAWSENVGEPTTTVNKVQLLYTYMQVHGSTGASRWNNMGSCFGQQNTADDGDTNQGTDPVDPGTDIRWQMLAESSQDFNFQTGIDISVDSEGLAHVIYATSISSSGGAAQVKYNRQTSPMALGYHGATGSSTTGAIDNTQPGTSNGGLPTWGEGVPGSSLSVALGISPSSTNNYLSLTGAFRFSVECGLDGAVHTAYSTISNTGLGKSIYSYWDGQSTDPMLWTTRVLDDETCKECYSNVYLVRGLVPNVAVGMGLSKYTGASNSIATYEWGAIDLYNGGLSIKSNTSALSVGTATYATDVITLPVSWTIDKTDKNRDKFIVRAVGYKVGGSPKDLIVKTGMTSTATATSKSIELVPNYIWRLQIASVASNIYGGIGQYLPAYPSTGGPSSIPGQKITAAPQEQTFDAAATARNPTTVDVDIGPRSSIAISGNGNRMAQAYIDSTTIKIQIYYWDGSKWKNDFDDAGLSLITTALDYGTGDTLNVSLSFNDPGTTLVIGNPNSSVDGTNSGEIAVYRRDTSWTADLFENIANDSSPNLGTIFHLSDFEDVGTTSFAGAMFGYSVCMSGKANAYAPDPNDPAKEHRERFVVGAPFLDGKNEAGTHEPTGGVWVFMYFKFNNAGQMGWYPQHNDSAFILGHSSYFTDAGHVPVSRGDYAGFSVSMNQKGTWFAFGCPGRSNAGGTTDGNDTASTDTSCFPTGHPFTTKKWGMGGVKVYINPLSLNFWKQFANTGGERIDSDSTIWDGSSPGGNNPSLSAGEGFGFHVSLNGVFGGTLDEPSAGPWEGYGKLTASSLPNRNNVRVFETDSAWPYVGTGPARSAPFAKWVRLGKHMITQPTQTGITQASHTPRGNPAKISRNGTEIVVGYPGLGDTTRAGRVIYYKYENADWSVFSIEEGSNSDGQFGEDVSIVRTTGGLSSYNDIAVGGGGSSSTEGRSNIYEADTRVLGVQTAITNWGTAQ